MADEVYERLNYTGPKPTTPAPTILKLATRDDAVIVVQSFSKAYCMTGWRLGWLVTRRDLAARATQLNEFVVSHAPSFTQRAGETALLWGENALAEMLVRLRENRDFCLAALAKMPGVTVPKPDGAFYLFPKIASAADSFDFCKRLLLETHVDWRRALLRRGRRRIGANLLRRRSSDSGRSHGAPRLFLRSRA